MSSTGGKMTTGPQVALQLVRLTLFTDGGSDLLISAVSGFDLFQCFKWKGSPGVSCFISHHHKIMQTLHCPTTAGTERSETHEPMKSTRLAKRTET